MRPLLLSLALLLPLPLLPSLTVEGELERARALVAEEDWSEARRLLETHLTTEGDDAAAYELLGEVLMELDERDGAAHRLDLARSLYEAKGDSRGVKRAERALLKADPLTSRRAKLQRDLTTKLYKAADKLFEEGHAERALQLGEPALQVATGKDARKLEALLEKVRKAFEKVDLDEASEEGGEDGGWPLIVHESDHYVLHANLEQSVIELVADTMDDIYGYYVLVYFDGDASAAASSKARIRVHPTRDSMLSNWQGGSAPEGWWSPGENQVTCYDTRTTTGSLDWMLETLFHEASHQFMTLLSRKGGSAPTWLNEGTACFFEGATAMADRRVLWPDAALKRLSSLSAMLNGGTGPTPTQVVSYAGGGSYPAEYYSFGWGLVFFLQQYEDPESLEYVYRPLYSIYREQITSRGGDSMKLFEEVFLGKESPLGHEVFADFEADWRKWILDDVLPLHRAQKDERRALRRAKVDRYVAAAAEAAETSRPAVAEIDLLNRALGHIEYIRKQIDGEEKDTDVELIALQADLLETLERPEAAAPLVERLLELADQSYWSPSEEEFAALEKRLRELDRKNYALRNAKRTRSGLLRTARALLEDYEEAEVPLPLRAYTFASRLGAALDDQDVLLSRAADLRAEARQAGALVGETRSLAGTTKDWTTIYTELSGALRSAPRRLELKAVRPHGLIRTGLELGDEYEVRATIERGGELHRSTVHGIVIAAVEEGDWLVFGVQRKGAAGLWRLSYREGSGVVTKKVQSFFLDPRPEDGDDLQLRVHVANGQWIEAQVNGGETFDATWPDDLPRAKYAGIYVKDGQTVLIDPVVERY